MKRKLKFPKLFLVPTLIGICAFIYKVYRYGWDTTLEGVLSWVIGITLLVTILGFYVTQHFGIDILKTVRRWFK